ALTETVMWIKFKTLWMILMQKYQANTSFIKKNKKKTLFVMYQIANSRRMKVMRLEQFIVRRNRKQSFIYITMKKHAKLRIGFIHVTIINNKEQQSQNVVDEKQHKNEILDPNTAIKLDKLTFQDHLRNTMTFIRSLSKQDRIDMYKNTHNWK
ncbi:hypothetical protein RFI_40352, partial [Reticulomyxa filosa]